MMTLEKHASKPKSGFVTENNMAMLTDLYQLTMNASYSHHNKNETVTFDLFYRKLPRNRGYMLAAGLEQVLHYLENLSFSEDDIDYLGSQDLFRKEFLETLRDFKFTGDVYAMPEGTPVFPNEPIIRITAPRMEAQLVETFLLNAVNFQTMIASKASRVVESADGRAVTDFGLRRAHSADAGMKASRACYIAGCVGTSNVLAGKEFGISIIGTMAHAYVMSFDSELEAFRAYASTFKDKSVLLIDTYDTLEGAKNAAIVAKELEREGYSLKGVRLDSGDLCELSKGVRKILDDAGLDYVKIVASNDLNEYKIKELIGQGACIDSFGVGTEMVTSKDAPAMSGVYKLVEDCDKEGNAVPRIKLAEGKITLPGKKQVYRLYDENGKCLKDIIALHDEEVEGEPLLKKVMENGAVCYGIPRLSEIRNHAQDGVGKISKDVKSGAEYKVELSPKLEKLVEDLKEKYRR
ncbi:MAG: nicotinate phosphoribosyltransferase [Candidatus Woesearchaeota archaeon]